MTDTKVIAVVGATGSQGGGLVRAILADPDHEFEVRALARNTRSGKAQELAAAGVEVVDADLNDQESMVRALKGAYGAYVYKEPDAVTISASDAQEVDVAMDSTGQLYVVVVDASADRVMVATRERARPCRRGRSRTRRASVICLHRALPTRGRCRQLHRSRGGRQRSGGGTRSHGRPDA